MRLIDKSTLVAEIEKLMDNLYDFLPDASKVENGTITISEACNTGKYTALESFRNYIDTLEAKEVDFEKKKMEWIEQLCKYFKANYLYVSGHESFISDFRMYAKNLK